MIILFLAFSMLFSFQGTNQSKNCYCRKAWDQSPKLGNIFTTMNGGRVKAIRGVVSYPNGEVMEDAVVEVFKSPPKLNPDSYTYEDVERITRGDRKAACRTPRNGRFCFKHLRAGKYLLRVGHLYDAQFSAVHVILILNPKARRSSRNELRIELPLSI
jgi:hypothetical protein